MTKAQLIEEELKASGWEYDHSATVRGYQSAGSVSEMAKREGFEWCRVHTSTCKGKRKEYQITNVYKRRIEA